MKFFNKSNGQNSRKHQFLIEISLTEVAKLIPQEWAILEPAQKIYPEVHWLIELEDNGFAHLSLINDIGKSLFINIEKELLYHQKFFHKHSYLSQPLARALGLKNLKQQALNKEEFWVWDIGGGMLGDSLLMKSFGIGGLIISERNPICGALIVNALKRTPVSNMIFHYSEGIDLIHSMVNDIKIKAIFYDPMFEKKSEKSKPQKAMQVFRQVLGEDQDQENLIQKILINLPTQKRLVLKRSIKSNSFQEIEALEKIPGQWIVLESKGCIYEVFIKK
jgi:hypothetical protein